MDLGAIIVFAGGVGLLLLGMRLMTDGLQVAAGPGLRELLARGTRTRVHALGSGLAITAVVQSSSAVTFATIGFVNAGLLSLPQSIGVIYGANLGTTVTSWLVALVGFKFDVRLLALPAIAIGMALRVVRGGHRAGAFGEALAGFGVFFIGIDVLKDAFSGVDALGFFDREHAYRALPLAGLGFLMTLVLQSSSATLAITLSAAASGVLPLPAAAAMVIGANVGTTSTALLAVIGATPAAKRVAAAHVVYNVVVALAAIALLPVLVAVVRPFDPATALAAFHTLTNLIGLALIWPVTPTLTRWLEQRFRRAEEDAAVPRHLDRNVAATPAIAIEAIAMELARVQAGARTALTLALTAPPTNASGQVRERCSALSRLIESIGEFTATVQRDPAYADKLAAALRVSQYLDDVVERIEEFAHHGSQAGPPVDAEVDARLQRLRTLAIAADKDGFEREYAEMKAALLRAGAEGRIPVRRMSALLDQYSALRRLVDQDDKAARLLAGLTPSSLDPAPALASNGATP